MPRECGVATILVILLVHFLTLVSSATFGEECTYSSNCSYTGGNCTSGTCGCDASLFFVNQSSCTSKISYDGDCSAAGSQCLSVLICKTSGAVKKCLCQDGQFWAAGSCSPQLTYGATCNTTGYSGTVCRPPLICSGSTCTCPADQAWSGTGCINSPTVTVTPPSSTPLVGQSTTIQCNTTDTSLTAVKWLKGGSEITVSGRYSGGSTETPSLSISDLQMSDSGTYTCQLTNAAGTGSGSVTLSVYALPTVTVTAPSTIPIVNQHATIQCSTTDLPVNAVKWTKGGSQITIEGRYSGGDTSTPSLTISSVQKADEGTYTCELTNNVGTGSGSADLKVIGPPTVQIGSSQTKVLGETVIISCSATSEHTVITVVQWVKDGSPLTSTSRHSGGTVATPGLTISGLTKGDAGSYKCRVSNSAGFGESQTATLTVDGDKPTVTVSVPATIPNAGTAVTITCSVSAVPPANKVEWFKDSNILTITGNYTGGSVDIPSLTISNVQNADEGTYICRVTNLGGTTDGSVTLSVKGIPTTTIGPGQTKVIGQPVTITCTVVSDIPVTSVKWKKDGFELTITSRYSGGTTQTPSLTIKTVNKTDAGSYQCIGANGDGQSASGTATLTVTGDIPVMTISLPSTTPKAGSNAVIACTASGNPAVTSVMWRKNGAQLLQGDKYSWTFPSTPSLTIANVDNTDEGTYTCQAYSAAGGTEMSVQLQVIARLKYLPRYLLQRVPRAADPNSDSSELTNTSSPSPISTTENITNIPVVTIGGNQIKVVSEVVEISCEVKSTQAILSVRWTHNGNNISIPSARYSGGNRTTPSLTIKSVQKTDVGSYKCFASNADGEGSSGTMSLTVDGGIIYRQCINPSYF